MNPYNLLLTLSLSPLRGARGRNGTVPDSLSPLGGERVGVRGESQTCESRY
jgi:hypothetical protein